MDEPVASEPQGRTNRAEAVEPEDARGDAASDQAAADAARLRYRRRGVGSIDPDERIGPILQADEQLIAVRRAAVVYRPEATESDAASPAVADVYVTTHRLVLVGPDIQFFDLATVDEATVSRERLLLVLGDGVGLVLEVRWPRLLRVEIAAARAARR